MELVTKGNAKSTLDERGTRPWTSFGLPWRDSKETGVRQLFQLQSGLRIVPAESTLLLSIILRDFCVRRFRSDDATTVEQLDVSYKIT
jgi:hypothetical protein